MGQRADLLCVLAFVFALLFGFSQHLIFVPSNPYHKSHLRLK